VAIFQLRRTVRRARRERNVTRHSLIYIELTRTIKQSSAWAIPVSASTQQPKLCDPEHNIGES
jgi:hypothetical protein